MSAPREFTAGEVIRVTYPFVRGTYEQWDENGSHQVATWTPGCRYDLAGEDAYAVADAEGEMIFTVVGVFKPGHYPTRVFYSRKFLTPDGHEFGKPGLRMATREKFRRLCKGYREPYDIEAAE